MTPALRGVLSALLPSGSETTLLRACLAPGDAGREAWAGFQKQERDLAELFRTDRGELKRLGPLLFDNVRRNGAPTRAPLLTVLKTGFLREELRSRIYQDILCRALRALEAEGISAIVLGGAALSLWAYDQPALRHSHDIDLLIGEPDLARAEAALRNAGFAAAGGPSPGNPGAAVLCHGTGLPVRLHTSLFELSCHPAPLEALRAGSRAVAVGEMSARVLGPEDSLAHVLGRAAGSPRRSNLQWACDAWMICARTPSLQQDRLLGVLGDARLLLAGAVLLRYLQELGAGIPNTLPEEAERRTRTVTGLERDLALYGLRRGGPRGLLGVLRRLPTQGTRVAMLRWLAFPSPDYVRWAYQLRSPLLTPVFYLARAASGLAGLARAMARRNRFPERVVPAADR